MYLNILVQKEVEVWINYLKLYKIYNKLLKFIKLFLMTFQEYRVKIITEMQLHYHFSAREEVILY